MATKSTRRAPKGKFSERERAFVGSAYPALGPAEIARKLGRSKSGVCKLIAEMKASGEIEPGRAARESIVASAAGPPDEADGTQDTLGRLRQLREVLFAQLRDAGPSQVARVAAEYRATVQEIARLEEAEAGDGSDDELGRLVSGIADAVRRAAP